MERREPILNWCRKDLVEQYGINETPLVIINLDRIKYLVTILNNIQKKSTNKISIYYALKANYMYPILETLQEVGIDGVEVISELEKNIAFRAGFNEKDIIYNGLFRTTESITKTLYQGGRVNIDSIDELEQVKNKVNRIGLRIHPELKEEGNFIGNNSKLGLNTNDIREVLKICRSNHIYIEGVHFHIFSNMTQHEKVVEILNKTLSVISEIEKSQNKKISYLDIGGGIAPLNNFGSIKNLTYYFQKIFSVINSRKSNIEIVLELGRFLISDSVFILTTTKGIKEKDNKRWVVLDIASNYLIPAPKADFKALPYQKLEYNSSKKEILNVFTDPICSPAGVIYEGFRGYNIKKGDLIIITNAGAYTSVMKEEFVFRSPKHIFIKNNDIYKEISETNMDEVLKYHGW